MADDDDLFAEEEEEETAEVEEKADNRDAIIQRLQKSLEKERKKSQKLVEEQEKAVQEKRLSALQDLAKEYGNESIAELYPAEAEPTPEAFQEWAAKYGWSKQEEQEQEVTEAAPTPMPAGLKNFHQGGGTPGGQKVYTGPELMRAHQAGEVTAEEVTQILAEGRLRKDTDPENVATNPGTGFRGFDEV